MTALRCPNCHATYPDGCFLVEHRCKTVVTAVVVDDAPLTIEDVDAQTDRSSGVTQIVCEGCSHRWTTNREITHRGVG